MKTFAKLILSIVYLIGSFGTMAEARGEDLELTLVNDGSSDLEFRYYPAANHGEGATTVLVPSKNSVSVPLKGNDPYNVLVKFPEGAKTGNIHANVGVALKLNELAQRGLRLSIHGVAAREADGRSQITYAAVDTGAGVRTTLHSRSMQGKESEAVGSILRGMWSTTYEAIDGTVQNSRDDFGSLQFQGNGFQGSFSDVLIVEHSRTVQVSGRWHAAGSHGDFYLTMDKSDPRKMNGHYFDDADADRARRFWRSVK